MQYRFRHGEQIHQIAIKKDKDTFRITIDNKTTYEATACERSDNFITFKVKDRVFNVYLAQDGNRIFLAVDGYYITLESIKDQTRAAQAVGSKENSVASPMPGLLIKLPVAIGMLVKAGTTLAIVEAMKMQNELRAPSDGVVKKINFKEGDQVDALKPIVELEP
jgi:acetyl/propionyl-CoA carboxylase alpha subunit